MLRFYETLASPSPELDFRSILTPKDQDLHQVSTPVSETFVLF